MDVNLQKRKIRWKIGLGWLGVGVALSGCSDTSEELPPPTASQVKAAQALKTPKPTVVALRYRVTGVSGQLSGHYTSAMGLQVPITMAPGASTWETAVSMPIPLMRSQGIELAAQSNTFAPLTVEVYGDGTLIASRSGTNPLLSIRKH